MKNKTKSFTDKQIADWFFFEEVRASGRFNMWTPQAREMTGLCREDYVFCSENYLELKEAAAKGQKPNV